MSLSAPTKITVPWANYGTKNTIPVESQIGITPGAASWTDGFPPLTMTAKSAGGIPPSGPDVNGGLNAISSALQWLQAGAGYAYDSTFATAIGGYPKWAMVQRSDGKGYWLNTSANNTNDPESSTSSGWIPAASNASSAITMTSSNVTLTALQAGAYTITLSGALTTNLQLIFPNWAQEWLVVNNCTGAFSVTCKTASGTGVAIAAGSSAIIYGDGTNINYYSGNAAQTFNVANATQSQHAVALGQVLNTTNDPTFADNSNKPASTGWIRGAMSSIATAAGFACSLAPNGYLKLPSWLGGVIIQWAKGTVSTTESSQTVTFPIPFPASCFFAGVFTQGDAADRFFKTTSWTNSNCVVFDNLVGTTSGTNYPLVFAIGA